MGKPIPPILEKPSKNNQIVIKHNLVGAKAPYRILCAALNALQASKFQKVWYML